MVQTCILPIHRFRFIKHDLRYIGNQKVTGINNTDDLEVLKTLSKTEATKKFYEILDTHRTGDITEDESITSSSSQDSNEDVNNNAAEVDVIKPKDPNE